MESNGNNWKGMDRTNYLVQIWFFQRPPNDLGFPLLLLLMLVPSFSISTRFI
jgi:hypothetical protein